MVEERAKGMGMLALYSPSDMNDLVSSLGTSDKIYSLYRIIRYESLPQAYGKVCLICAQLSNYIFDLLLTSVKFGKDLLLHFLKVSFSRHLNDHETKGFNLWLIILDEVGLIWKAKFSQSQSSCFTCCQSILGIFQVRSYKASRLD